MIKKYVKKPITIEAVQWGRNAINLIDGESFNIDDYNVYFDGKEVVLIIHTLEGNMKCYPSDYIVRGVDGEFYPVKKEIFEKTYVEAKEDEEFVSVRKDRLENLIEHSYETSCPLVDSSACHLNGPHFTCSDCEFNYDSLDDDSELPVKNVIKWMEGKENE